jgi:hypothetical protein
MKQRLHHPLRRAKLPPILEIDEYGLPVSELSVTEGRRWSDDEDEASVQLGDWPIDFDD